RRGISEYTTQVRKSFNDLPPELLRKLSRIADYALGALDLPEVDIGGVTARGTATLFYYQLILSPTLRLHLVYQSPGLSRSSLPESDVPISEATMRLIDNILPMCEQLAWDHLRGRFRVPDSPISGRKKVFLSYRKGGAERREFVQAIAHRLGREGFAPWYDEWEILAGDSLPREMAAGLERAYGIITILTADYPGERWALEELENAITQRVNRGIKVIPVLYERCEVPVLLQTLSYVDCTVHDPEKFEQQFLRIIDALNEIELNPYR